MKIKEGIWKMIQWRINKKQLGYTDEGMKIFRDNQTNENILYRVPALMNKYIFFPLRCKNVVL